MLITKNGDIWQLSSKYVLLCSIAQNMEDYTRLLYPN